MLKPVREGEGDVWAELRPAETLSIDFANHSSRLKVGMRTVTRAFIDRIQSIVGAELVVTATRSS